MRIIKHKLLPLILLLLCTFELQSQQSYEPLTNEQIKMLVPSNTRYVFSLNGKWEKLTESGKWAGENFPNSSNDSEILTVRKTFKIDKEAIDKYSWQLYFLGVSDYVEVYFNDQFIGRYFGGMTPLTVNIPKKMFISEANILKLIVFPKEDNARLINENGVFISKSYTGVIRDILLIGTPAVWVNNIRYKYELKKGYSSYDFETSADISADDIKRLMLLSEIRDSLGVINEKKTSIAVTATLKNKQTGEIIYTSSSQSIDIERDRTISTVFKTQLTNITPWTPETPVLYELTYTLSKRGIRIDDYSKTVGFVDVVTKIKDDVAMFYINDEEYQIKAVDYIEDYAKGDQTLSAKRIREDLLLLKTLGANTVRFKYNAPHPLFTHYCNEIGLFMLIELPVENVPTPLLNSDEIMVRMKNMAKNLLNEYNFNPSLFGWGVYEGVQEGTPESQHFTKTIAELFRANTDKRIYKTVLLGSGTVSTGNVDFILFRDNKRIESFEYIKERLISLKSQVKKIPVLFNYGVPVQVNNHNGYSDPFSVESQAYYISNIYKFLRDNSFAGSVIWSFNDYKLNNPMMLVENDNKYLCSSGLLDRERQHRLGFKLTQSLFNDEKEPLLSAGSHSEYTPLSFIILGVLLSLVFVLLINRFRRFREYLFRSVFRPYNFYADIRDQRIMSSIQSIFLGLVISFTIGVFVSSIFYFYRTSENAQFFLMLLMPSDAMQSMLYDMIWIPEMMILIVSLMSFGLIFLVALIIKLISFFIRAKIFYSDTITITIWSGAPLIALLPFAVVLYRLLLLFPGLITIISLLSIIILIWVYLRVLRATAVVFDIRSYISYITGTLVLGAVLAAIIFFYDMNYSTMEFANYWLYVMLDI